MTIASRGDLEGMERVGRLVAEAHKYLATQLAPGMTTAELDERGARFLRARGARSAPQITYGFPGFNLISVNYTLSLHDALPICGRASCRERV